jgi:hypothetical protein
MIIYLLGIYCQGPAQGKNNLDNPREKAIIKAEYRPAATTNQTISPHIRTLLEPAGQVSFVRGFFIIMANNFLLSTAWAKISRKDSTAEGDRVGDRKEK